MGMETQAREAEDIALMGTLRQIALVRVIIRSGSQQVRVRPHAGATELRCARSGLPMRKRNSSNWTAWWSKPNSNFGLGLVAASAEIAAYPKRNSLPLCEAS
jgi:hypothetical protein